MPPTHSWLPALLLACGGSPESSPRPEGLRIDVGATDCASTSEVQDEEMEEGEAEEEPASCAAPGWRGDGPYDATRGFGWVGEAYAETVPEWWVTVFPIATGRPATPTTDVDAYLADVHPHRSSADLSAYRIDVPSGRWTVTVHLVEPTFPDGGLRVYDLDIERQTWPGLDLGEQVGQSRVASVSMAVIVQDGAVDLGFRGAGGVLTAVELVPGHPTAPSPTGLETRAGAGEVLLRWDVPDGPVRGWWVERAVDGGPFEAVGPPQVVPSFVDREVPVGASVRHRITALSGDGTPAGSATTTPVQVRSPASLGLPVIDLQVAPSDLVALYIDPAAEVRVPATATEGGDTETGTLKLRGQSTRWLPKRSYTLDLDSGKLDGREKLKLLAETSDPSRLQQALSYDLLERMGGLASTARPVLVRLNGEVDGVYQDVEAVGDAFLEARGYGVDDRWRIRTSDLSLQRDDSGSIDLSGFEKKENEEDPSPELEALLVWLDAAGEHEVAAGLGAWFDEDVLLDYLAGQILFANPEVVDGGHYLALDPADGAFLVVPWDHNNSTWSRAELPLHTWTAYAEGWAYRHWTRALNVGGFRNRLADRLQAALDGAFAADTQHAAIERIVALQQPGLDVEPYLFLRHQDAGQRASVDGLHGFVDARRAYIQDHLEALRVLGVADLAPVGVDPAAGLVDVGNLGGEPVSMAGCTLAAPDQEVGVSLGEGSLSPGAVQPVEVAVGPDGGRLTLRCGELDDAAVRSLVHVPALAEGQTYVRGVDGWSVVP